MLCSCLVKTKDGRRNDKKNNKTIKKVKTKRNKSTIKTIMHGDNRTIKENNNKSKTKRKNGQKGMMDLENNQKHEWNNHTVMKPSILSQQGSSQYPQPYKYLVCCLPQNRSLDDPTSSVA